METLAKVVVLAIQRIADRDTDSTADQDVDMLERLAAKLQAATVDERERLIVAANELGLSVGLLRLVSPISLASQYKRESS